MIESGFEGNGPIVKDLESLIREELQLVKHDWSHQLREIYWQIEAFVDVRSLLDPRRPLPPLRSWALSPDSLRYLVAHIAETRPNLVLECGSGASSVFLGYALEKFGGGRLVALEHDQEYLDRTRRLIESHELQATVEVCHAPLEQWKEFQWYSREAVGDLSGIQTVLVDGPPGHIGPLARYPAVPLLIDRLELGATVVLDDATRPDELAVRERWLAEYPRLSVTQIPTEKGLSVLTLGL